MEKERRTWKFHYSCRFPGCTSRYYTETASNPWYRNKHFFQFPREFKKEQLMQWKQVCHIGDDVSCEYYCVCDDHFFEKDFTNFRRQRLNYGVIPKYLQLAVYHPFQYIMETEESVDPEEAASMSPRSDEEHDHSNHELLPENEEIVSTVPQPSTTNYIRKHIADPCHMVEELPEVYTFVTLPHLEQFHLNLQWVYKILSHEEGQERIIYKSPSKDDKDGFLLIKDRRWDGVNLDNLHLLAIAYRPGILSLRDLRQHHLSLLKNIYVMGKEVIMEKYDVVGSQLRIFIQYQPSFYHLHVHFTTINDGISEFHCGKAHLLDSVINIIQACPTYYEISPLTFCLKESDDLFEKFEAHGLVKRIGSS